MRRRVLMALALLLAGALGLLLIAGAVLTRPFSAPAWVEAPQIPVALYREHGLDASGADLIPPVTPFHLRVDPMEALLLFNFDEDPDTVYVGFEPQAFDDDVHGRGLLVIGWRVDGRVDIFHDPDLRLDPRMYGIAGAGLHEMAPRPLSASGATLALGPGGATADFAFVDLLDRPVRLLVRESDPAPRTRFGLLAPMGTAATAPPALPLVYVDGFTFVRRRGTELRVEIDGRAHTTDPIPLLLDGRRVHFVRYSAEPLIAFWNHDLDAEVRRLAPVLEPGADTFVAEADGVRYALVANGLQREIRRMSRSDGDREVSVAFSPPFPHILALVDGAEVDGAFRITAPPGVGTVTGRWRVTRQQESVQIALYPEGGWTPGPAPRMARLLFRVIPVFRQWPTTYAWHATLDVPADVGAHAPLPTLVSGWERIEAP